MPDAVLELEGAGGIGLVGRIDLVNGRLWATVEKAPDASVSRVIVDMQGGRKGLIVNSRNLCWGKNRARASLGGHNGRKRTLRPVVRAMACKKRRRARRSSLRR